MQLTNILSKTVKTQLFGKAGELKSTLTTSGPLSSYLSALNTFQATIENKMPRVDALNTALMSVDAIPDFGVDLELNPKLELEPKLISEEDANNIVNAIYSAGDMFSAEYDKGLSITSGAGLTYTMVMDSRSSSKNIYWQTRDGIKSFLTKTADGYLLHPYCYPVNFSTIPTARPFQAANTVLATLQILCARKRLYVFTDTIAPMVKALSKKFNTPNTVWGVLSYFAPNATTIVEAMDDAIEVTANDLINFDVRENLFSVFYSLIASCEINQQILNTITAIKTGGLKDFLSGINETISSKTVYIATFFKGLKKAFCSQGLKGAIIYILNYAKSTQFTDESGALVFTENTSYMPKEYIAGMISTVIGLVSAAASLIAAAFNPVIGAIVALVGSIGMSIFNSFKGDLSNTNGTVIVSDDISNDISILPYVPTGLFQFEVSARGFEWLQDSFLNGHSCVICQVPGGAFFVGPGSFDENDKTKMNTVRMEFHPSSVCFADRALHSLFPGSSQCLINQNQRVDLKALFEMYPHQDIIDKYYQALQHAEYIHPVCNSETGALSNDDDILVRKSICLHTFIFMVWFFAHRPPFADNIETICFSNDEGSESHLTTCLITGALALCSDTEDIFTAPWTAIVSGADESTHEGNIIHMSVVTDEQQSGLYAYISRHDCFNVSVNAIMLQEWQGCADDIPQNIKYEVYPAKYNKTTFWLYVALAAAATIAVTVATVVMTLKVKKAIRNKRASNTAKYQEKLATAQQATQGTKSVYNEETHRYEDVPFDTNSPEGKAYIKDCYKDLYKQQKRNNRWAKLIGGTRYDMTTYYGEAIEDEGGMSLDDIKNSIFNADQSAQASDFADSNTATNDQLPSAITELQYSISGHADSV